MTANPANQNPQKETAHAFVDKAADKIHKIINDTGAEMLETKDALQERLQANPLVSLAIALGAGILLDRVVSRPRVETMKVSGLQPQLLMGLTALGQTAVNQMLYRKLIADTAKVAALVVFGALIAGGLAVGGLYALYQGLLGYGLTAQAAGLSVAAGAVALIAAIAFGTARIMRRLNRTVLLMPAAANAQRMVKKLTREFKHLMD